MSYCVRLGSVRGQISVVALSLSFFSPTSQISHAQTLSVYHKLKVSHFLESA